MTGREKPLGREIPIGELIAEKHADNGGNREAAQNPGLLGRGEAQAGEVAEYEGIPRAPDEEFQDHHQEQLEANGSIHKLNADGSMSEQPPELKALARIVLSKDVAHDH